MMLSLDLSGVNVDLLHPIMQTESLAESATDKNSSSTFFLQLPSHKNNSQRWL